MTWATLDLELPTGGWVAAASAATPDTRFRIRTTTTTAEEAVVVLELERDSGTDAIDRLKAHTEVRRVVDVGRDGDEHVVHVVADVPSFLRAADLADCPFGFPMVVENGTATVDVVSSHAHVAALERELRRTDVDVGVRSIGKSAEAPRILTEGQASLVHAALRKGYYDTPRRCTLSELAESRGIAKSTCSEVLHRAEGRLVRALLEGAAATAGPRPRPSAPPN